MARTKSKFETEVHLGLLVIIFVLLSVNFISNVVLYRARSIQVVAAEQKLRASTIALNRVLRNNGERPLSDRQITILTKKYSLVDIMVIDSQPADDQPETNRKWFADLALKYPPDSVPELAKILVGAERQQLARKSGEEYFYVTPISVGNRRKLLVVSIILPELAYLEDAGFIIQLVALGSFITVLLVYLFLSRFIFGPIRRITSKARQAGRKVDDSENEVEGVAADYEKIIEQLRDNESELLRLNKEVRDRAASLEQFNLYLLASIDSGIVTLSGAGTVLSDNGAARRLLGTQEDSFVGIGYEKLFSGCPELTAMVTKALSSGEVSGYREIQWEEKPETKHVFGVTLSIIRDNRQNRVGLAVLINDLTEINNLKRVLDKQKQLASLGEMAAGLAHQIRNSLGAISGFGNLVKRRTTAENILSNVESLLQESNEAESLISRFLSFARPLALEASSFNLKEFLAEIIDSFKVRPSCSKTEFDLICEKNYEYTGDTVLLKQAVSNIVENAVIACEGLPGLIEIEVKSSPGDISISITDSGSGIPAEDIDKLFTPFFSSRPSGSGLGLALASKVIDLHDGHIFVESQIGRGSCFTIRLPSVVSETDVVKIINEANMIT